MAKAAGKTPYTKIDRFDGGLKTNVPESELAANFTGSMGNFEITDTQKIKTRKGYRNVSGTLSSNPILALARYYKKNGNKYWVAVSGTSFQSYQSGITQVPKTTVQAETLTTSPNTISYPSASGGAVVQVVGSATFNIPVSTKISFKAMDTGITGSYSLDGGAYFNTGTNGQYSVSSLGYTTHTVKVKPRSDNSLFRMTSTLERWCGISRDYTASISDKVEIAFRTRNADATRNEYTGIEITTRKPSMTLEGRTIFVGWADGRNVLSVGVKGWGLGETWWPIWENTSIAISTTWTILEFTPPNYFTEPKIRILNGITRAVLWESNWKDHPWVPYNDWGDGMLDMAFFCHGYAGKQPYLDVDSIRKNGALVFTGDSLTGWTQFSSAALAVIATDTVFATPYCNVDWFEYEAPATWLTATHTGYPSANCGQLGFALLNDVLYTATNKDVIHKFDGTLKALTGTGTMPTGGHMVVHEGRLWIAGNESDPAQLRWSAPDDATDWTTTGGAGYWYLGGQDSGAECTGLSVWNDMLWYFSRSKIFAVQVTGTEANWERRVMHPNIGCVAPKTLVPTKNALVFMGPGNQVYAYGAIPGLNTPDGSDLLWVSENIQDQLDTISASYLDKCCGVFYRDRYWLAVPLNGSTYNNTVFVYKFPPTGSSDPGAWMKFTNLYISDFELTQGTEYGLYGGDSRTGKFHELDYGYNDDGSAIDSWYEIPPVNAGGYETIKVLSRILLAAESDSEQTVYVDVTSDDLSSPETTVELNSTTRVQPRRILASGRGRYFKTAIRGSGHDQPYSIAELIYVWRNIRFR